MAGSGVAEACVKGYQKVRKVVVEKAVAPVVEKIASVGTAIVEGICSFFSW